MRTRPLPPLTAALLAAVTLAAFTTPQAVPAGDTTPAPSASVDTSHYFLAALILERSNAAASGDQHSDDAGPPCSASWYGGNGDGFAGKPTASGEPFDPEQLTAAAWDIPLGTYVEVTHVDSGNTVTVRINDRGPAKRLHRCIDLSRAAFAAIAPLGAGITDVTVTPLTNG